MVPPAAAERGVVTRSSARGRVLEVLGIGLAVLLILGLMIMIYLIYFDDMLGM